MFDMLGKLNELRKSMDEIKARLDTVSVEGAAGEGAVKVIMNGNRKLTGITIDEKLLTPSRKEELEDYIEIAVNRASENAQQVSESEMKAAGQGLLPNIPGLF
jgi:DNA-binding YbaB/EbfC family protein